MSEIKPEPNSNGPVVPADPSIEDLDKLIEHHDPEFKAFVDGVKNETFGEVEDPALQEIDVSDLEVVVDPEAQEKAFQSRNPKLYWFVRPWFALKKRARNTKILIRQSLDRGYLAVYNFFTGDYKKVLAQLLVLLKKAFLFIKKYFDAFSDLSFSEKFMLFMAIGLFILSGLLLRATLKGRWLPDFEVGPLTSFENTANQAWTYDPLKDLEEFYGTRGVPEFVVLLDKIVVNLKRVEGDSTLPMGTFEFYIEGDSQETVVEIKDRSREMLDVIQRVTESFSYDDLESINGKIKLKTLIRQALNNYLNQGFVKNVYLKTFIIKP